MKTEQVARAIRRWRQRRGLTQEALATRAGVTRPYLARLEGGQHEVRLATLAKIAKALGVPVTKLLS